MTETQVTLWYGGKNRDDKFLAVVLPGIPRIGDEITFKHGNDRIHGTVYSVIWNVEESSVYIVLDRAVVL